MIILPTTNEWINSDVIHWGLSRYCGLDSNPHLGYIEPLMVQARVHEHNHSASPKKTKAEALKRFPKLFREMYDTYKGLVIPIHGEDTSHWSLAFYSRAKNHLYHYDTRKSVHPPHWIEADLNVEHFFKVYQLLVDWSLIPPTAKCFSPGFIPIQPQGWECGYFVILFTYILSQKQRDVNAGDPISNYDIIESGYADLFNMNVHGLLRTNMFEFLAIEESLRISS